MNKDNLLNGRMKRVSEAVVRAVPVPERTASWRPYSHGEVLDALAKAIEKSGIDIVHKEYSLAYNGAKMFAVWEFRSSIEGENFAIGIRNSTDKSFSVALCPGVRYFGNLAFDSGIELFRRHSSSLDFDELVFMAERMLSDILKKDEQFFRELLKLENQELSLPSVFLLSGAATRRRNVLTASDSKLLISLMFRSGGLPLSLGGFYGALIDLISEMNLIRFYIRNLAINDFIESEASFLLSDDVLDCRSLEEYDSLIRERKLQMKHLERVNRRLTARKVRREYRLKKKGERS